MPQTLNSGDEIVPGYVLVRKLGAGGSGEVWVARVSGGVQVAVKIISDLALIASDRELDSLRVVREVKHPNLCPLFGVWFFDDDDNLLSTQETEYILGTDTDVTETVALNPDTTVDPGQEFDTLDSGTLRLPNSATKPAQMVVAMGLGEQTVMDRLIQVQAEKEAIAGQQSDEKSVTSEQPMGIDTDELMRYITSAASAIDELNERHNIYHCDIKPQNILLVGGQAQVCDFGLARKVEDSRKTTIAFGTPAYGAPEMLFERTYSKTIDQYSLAVTYYELRTGKLPYSSITQSALLRAKATGEVDLSRVPPAERDVLARATDLDPKKRFANCQAMAAALARAIEDPETVVPAKSNRSRLTAPLAGASVVALLTVAGLFAPWDQLFNAEDAGEMPPALVGQEEPVDPAAVVANEDQNQSGESDKIGAAEAIVLQEEPEPEAKPEPESPKIDINRELGQLLAGDRQTEEKLDSVVGLLELHEANVGELDESSIDRIIEVIEQRSSEFTDSRDTAELQPIVSLTRMLIPIVQQQIGSETAQMARLRLNQLNTGRVIAQSNDESVADEVIEEVRRCFDNQNSYTFRPASYQAAMAIAETWIPKFSRTDWDFQLAERDMVRAQQLAVSESANPSDLAALHRSYLVALLDVRRRSDQPELFNAATVRVSKLLGDDQDWSAAARSALALADPEAKVHQPQSITADQATLTLLPEQLHASYYLGAGWNQWISGRIKSAVDQWEKATGSESLVADIAAPDRHAAAEQLFAWLLARSAVQETTAATLRYEGKAGAIDPILNIAHQLSEGNTDLKARIEREQFICSVAAGDFETAKQRMGALESNAAAESNLSPQQGRALFELSLNELKSADESLDPVWANRLLQSCNAQVDPAWFEETKSRSQDAKRARDELFTRCFLPVMENIRSAIATPEAIENAKIEQQPLTQFCDYMVSLLTKTDRRSEYGAVIPCLRDIELAANIAGRNTKQRNRRAELFFYAARAFARIAHEQTDDLPDSELIEAMRRYRDQSIKYGTNGYTDCLEGLVAKEEAFRETDGERAQALYDQAVAKFTSAIHGSRSGASSLLSFAHAGRAQSLQRSSIVLPDDRKERQLTECLDDARKAVDICRDALSDQEYALENRARICCAVTQISKSIKPADKLTLTVEATHAINEAIAIRKNLSLDSAQLSITKLFVLWIDTLVSRNTSHARASIQSAKKWVKETEPIGKQAKSSRLKCNWYFNSAMILEQAGETEQALKYLIAARQIAGRDLAEDERVTHLIALAYINLKSYQLRIGGRAEKIELIDELTRELSKIAKPTPPIANERDFYLKVLKERRSAL